MKYFIIAGEASGDLHAGKLINALKLQDPDAEFAFFGGDNMQRAAGRSPIVHYKNMAYMGFIEVAKHLKEILGYLTTAKNAIDAFAPDAVVLVDYPSFNLKVAKYAYKKGIPCYYYISPKVWAWKEYRVKDIKKYITELYSILPFEVPFYNKHNFKINYVGNPSVEELTEFKEKCNGTMSNSKKIAIVPGSRAKEIVDNLPVMLEAALQNAEPHELVIAGAPNISLDLYKNILQSAGLDATDISIEFGKTYEIVANSLVALVTSGTATLETAILKTPQIVCYRMSGSKLVYWLFEKILKIKFVSLPNLIVDKEIIPELLLNYCTVKNISANIRKLISQGEDREKMLAGYDEMLSVLGDKKCAATAAELLIKSASKIKK